jgi:ERCC4-type nuclease
MFQFFINPNEPRSVKNLFGETAIEEPMPYDMQLCTKRGMIPIERKEIPSDFLASVLDGRLSRQIVSMREASPIYVLLLHGEFIFGRDGSLSLNHGNQKSNWTRKAIRNLKRTIQYVEGAFIEEAHDDNELVEVVTTLQEYFDAAHHFSMKSRPSIESDWFIPQRDDRILNFYQGLPGVSVIRARTLFKSYPRPLDLFRAELEDLETIDGFGKKMANRIYMFLRTGDYQ